MDYNNNPMFSDKYTQLKERFLGSSSFNKLHSSINKLNKHNEKAFSFTNESFANNNQSKKYNSLLSNKGDLNLNRQQQNKSFNNKFSKNSKNNINNQDSNLKDEISCYIGKEYHAVLHYTYDYEYNKYYSHRVVNNDSTNTNNLITNKNRKLKLVSENYELDYSNLSDSFPDEFAEKYYKVPISNGILLCFNPLRHCVSGGRIRFIDNQVDLDLSFITKKVIAMCYPSSNCFESLYRNPLKDLNQFFSKYLNNKVKVSLKLKITFNLLNNIIYDLYF